MFNDIISYHSGFDLIGNTIMQCLGEGIDTKRYDTPQGYYAHSVIHSLEDGYYEAIEFAEELEKCIIFKNVNVKPGDKVSRFVNSGFRIGLLLLKFESYEQQQRIITNIYDYINVKVNTKVKL